MDNFNLYAQFYDLLYQDKDYAGEADYIDKLIKKEDPKARDILDLGCGTGIHADLLSTKGYQVDGVDLSEQMIKRASENYNNRSDLQFFQGDIRSFRNNKKYDVVTSLFHVFSYQNSNEDLLRSFKTANENLKDGGLLIFDFWYGPGVLTDPPVIRNKKLENSKISVLRKAYPEMHIDKNVVDVNYEILITDLTNMSTETIREKHSMRFLFQPEIEMYLKATGFELLGFYNWLTLVRPTIKTWNAVAVAKKCNK